MKNLKRKKKWVPYQDAKSLMEMGRGTLKITKMSINKRITCDDYLCKISRNIKLKKQKILAGSLCQQTGKKLITAIAKLN